MSDSNQFKLAGVMGMPVFQSRSPILHNYWIKKYNLKGAYGHFPVQIKNVEAAVRGLSALGIAGCNITQPHKLHAMKLMDQLSPMAQRIGAINCIVVQPDGSLHGFNNDGFGYIQSLKDAKPTWRADEGPIVVLGSGGAARAVVISLLDEGAKEIRLINRTRAKADELACVNTSVVKTFEWDERDAALEGAAMLVNTTNQGMYGQPPLEIQLDALPKTAMVSDLIYIPLETPLLAAARERGNLTVNGLGMLLNQAIPAFEAWFGVKPEITDELRKAILATF
jgi:shikimate dehydrogenase